MLGNYILVNREPVACNDTLEWGRWFEEATFTKERIVAQDDIGGCFVSTVFLGLDHNFGYSDRPILFETMIFNGPNDQYQERCSTWEEAALMHKLAIVLTLETLPRWRWFAWKLNVFPIYNKILWAYRKLVDRLDSYDASTSVYGEDYVERKRAVDMRQAENRAQEKMREILGDEYFSKRAISFEGEDKNTNEEDTDEQWIKKVINNGK